MPNRELVPDLKNFLLDMFLYCFVLFFNSQTIDWGTQNDLVFGILVMDSEQEFKLVSEGISCGVIWEEDQKEITCLWAQ